MSTKQVRARKYRYVLYCLKRTQDHLQSPKTPNTISTPSNAPTRQWHRTASREVSLLSGAIAGVFSAIVSQPADVVLSRVAKGAKSGGDFLSQVGNIFGEVRSGDEGGPLP